MATDNLFYQDLKEQVEVAFADKTNLVIQGGGTKNFFGCYSPGEFLDTKPCLGIISYEPTELVITARAGTSLSEIENTLSSEKQMLAFEPPYFGKTATFGGMVASGLSGPRRPYVGAVRDFVLGIKCLTGSGKVLTFGGQVMKNVAGYDVSRLMTGALGTLGVLLEISIKVLPKPEIEISLTKPLDEKAAIEQMNIWAGKPLPISAACYEQGNLNIRLSGNTKAVTLAQHKLRMDSHAEGLDYWQKLREHELSFFTSHDLSLWRVSVPPATRTINLSGEWLIDWGGAQRWLKTSESVENIRTQVSKMGGHATLFRGGDEHCEVFHPLAPALQLIHKRLKKVFDPENILNKGRMYEAM